MSWVRYFREEIHARQFPAKNFSVACKGASLGNAEIALVKVEIASRTRLTGPIPQNFFNDDCAS